MKKISYMEKLRIFEAFAGYGSQAMALKRLKEDYSAFDYEVVGISEIDKYAIKSYNAVHGETKNYGDISKIDWNGVPDFDLLTYSFPCTDLSNAGLMKGMEKGSGTRSSLLWECEKAVKIKRPKFLLMENVKALVSKRFYPCFNEWIMLMDSYGYDSSWKILNAKDYGVPQNRERVFCVSVLRDENGGGLYDFPKPFELKCLLDDVLEDNVNESMYIKREQVDKFINMMRK